jgi:redox-sensitive bicupin YhaK (pirin superfamily)
MISERIVPPVRELGDGFQVRRALPAAQCRSVGPFVFFDQMGPVALDPGKALDVRPHPHIGLATVTYLFEGQILHRDSLGNVQPIRPREVNWMIAGRGIVHSERTPTELRTRGSRIFGVQTWLALPLDGEEGEPAFSHHEGLPAWEEGGVSVIVILGDLFWMSSPVPTLSPTIYADVSIAATRRFAVPAAHEQRGIHVVEGRVEIDGEPFAAGEMAILETGAESFVSAAGKARVLFFGGARLDAPRHVWWNFVSSREERIAQAAADWEAGRFAKVPGETEFIPLPERGRPKPVSYP